MNQMGMHSRQGRNKNCIQNSAGKLKGRNLLTDICTDEKKSIKMDTPEMGSRSLD
jgi:hypothetical protein